MQLSKLAQEAKQIVQEADLIVDQAGIETALDQIAQDLNAHYLDQEVILINVLNGATIVVADLMKRLSFPVRLDYVHATRYSDDVVGQILKWHAHPRSELSGKHVLIVDDILDEGHTLAEIIHWCQGQGSASVQVAVLVEKTHQRKREGVQAGFVGLQIPDRYVFGYGMDYKGYLRNLPAIYAVKE